VADIIIINDMKKGKYEPNMVSNYCHL